MLRELKVENLALIESLHLIFEEGLTVLTGETGAGKSIFLQAIALLSGGRASSSWIRTGMEKAEVEALFELPANETLRANLAELAVETEDDLLIKRVLLQNGKSRFYVNGGLSTSKLVSKISEQLLSVASQHDHQQLLVPRFHLDFIDLVGELWEERQDIAALYNEWQGITKKCNDLKLREVEKEQRHDFLQYQTREIEAARLEPGEDEILAENRMRLKSSDDLRRLGQKCYSALLSAASNLAQARKDVEAMADLDTTISALSESISEQSYLADENSINLREYIESLPNDSSELENISERIDLLQQLKRKYGPTLDDVICFFEKAKYELAELDSMEEILAELTKKQKNCEQNILKKAKELSRSRRKIAGQLSSAMKKELESLSFAQAEFEVIFHNDDEAECIDGITPNGLDRVEFMFSANPGEPLKPLVKIASGGELSRVMLGLKCLLAKKDLVETVIFDEVDSGIGGKAAEAVANKIKELARHHQVMCITHLPQIAARGNCHYMVEKKAANGRTKTNIFGLNQEARVAELARMLAGDSVSSESMAFAQELILRNKSI